MPEVSFVCPCYILDQEILDLTRAAIHSFREAAPKAQLVIVDDGSPIGGGWLREEADIYIRHKENKGFVKSINDGIKIADGEYIVCVNNDVRVAHTLVTVAKEILSDKEIYSVHPRMLRYKESRPVGNTTWKTGKERWCQTSCFIVRGSPIYLFDDRFKGKGGGFEDWDYWAGIKDMGLCTAYTNKTCFWHKDSSTTQRVGEESKRNKENLEFYKKKWGAYPDDHYRKMYPEQSKLPWRPFP